MAAGRDMTPPLLAAALLAITRLPIGTTCAVGASALVAQRVPGLAIPLGAGWLAAWVARRRRVAKEAVEKTGRDLTALAELTAIALAGGLGIRRSLELAGATVGGPIGREVAAVLNLIRIEGSVVLASVDGIAVLLYRTLGRAALSGAPLLESIDRLAEQLNSDQTAAREQAVRRLPIVMLFPLTLLILPGFVLLTVAPALLESFGRLEM